MPNTELQAVRAYRGSEESRAWDRLLKAERGALLERLARANECDVKKFQGAIAFIDRLLGDLARDAIGTATPTSYT
jgi:hypothetical protein